MNKSRIQWTDYTWSPVTGCSKVSQGCKNCYAEAWHKRFRAGDFSVRLHPEKLHEPLPSLKGFERKHGRRPRVFVGPMTDLFHDDVPDDFLYELFVTMALSPHIDFQVVTKRPHRMREWASYDDGEIQSTASIILGRALDRIHRDPAYSDADWVRTYLRYPLPNVWLGVTAENQQEADRRIPLLLQTRAAVRWASVEPMLGPVDLTNIRYAVTGHSQAFLDALICDEGADDCGDIGSATIDWVVCGGESGAGARPMDIEWVRDLRDQCHDARVPFFFKQWGPKGGYVDESGMPLLDGKVHDEFPEVRP